MQAAAAASSLHKDAHPCSGCSAAHPTLVDAPVSGGTTGASKATLTFMVPHISVFFMAFERVVQLLATVLSLLQGWLLCCTGCVCWSWVMVWCIGIWQDSSDTVLSRLGSKQVLAVTECIGSAYTASLEKATHACGDIFKLLLVEQATCTSDTDQQSRHVLA